VTRKKRSLFRELMSGVEAMRGHREGRLTLKTREVQPITVPPIDADMVRETREALNMSRHVFAFKLGVNPRTLEYRFKVANNGHTVDATYTGLVPDTFKDTPGEEAEVVLKGRLTNEGFHVAPNGVMAKCPSKYEQRASFEPKKVG